MGETLDIRKIAIIGSGVMGSGIAAHLANCGIPSYLLDIVEPDLSRITKAKPAHLYDADDIRLITPGLLDQNLEKLKECDWVIEAVLERLETKLELYQKIEPYFNDQAWVSSNTSGLSLKKLAGGWQGDQKKRFCVTHFFNPPRYLPLVELVATPDTDQKGFKELATFVEKRLGKGVVFAKDTPNFIANRIGVFHVFDIFHRMEKNKWRVGIVDKVMGPPTGHPKSAVFRTADLVGIDTLALVGKTNREKVPDFVTQMIAQKLLGEKTKSGFYKKDPETKEILELNLETLCYQPQEKIKTDSLGKTRSIENPAEKIKTVVLADDEAGSIAWPTMSAALIYAADRIPEIADSILEIDRAMRWGFNWELGPFEMWDALGVQQVVDRLQKENRRVPKLIWLLLEAGGNSFYKSKNGIQEYFDFNKEKYIPVSFPKEVLFLKSKKDQKKVIEENDGASLIDLSDGVFCLEFHSKMNAIDDEIIGMLHKGIDRVEKEGKGLLIYNDGVNFSVGANIMLILLTAQQKDWMQLGNIIDQFQGAMQRLRFSKKPVVAAPFQMALGGGCEVCLGADRVQAHAETYIGLVEVGVGLIPAGCGCKNMILNWEQIFKEAHPPKDKIWFSPDDRGPFPKVQKAFEAIAMAKVATSAKEGRNLGFFTKEDHVTINRDHLLYEAKQSVLELAKHYTPPKEREDIQLPGLGGKMAIFNAIQDFKNKGLITEHDETIAKLLAHVLTGGDMPNIHYASEKHILELEKEAFLKLCGMEKTQERIQHMLLQGKPLRN